MAQVLHQRATTTHAIRAAIQRSTAPLKELAAQYGLNQKMDLPRFCGELLAHFPASISSCMGLLNGSEECRLTAGL